MGDIDVRGAAEKAVIETLGKSPTQVAEAVLAAIGWSDPLSQAPPKANENPSTHDLIVDRARALAHSAGSMFRARDLGRLVELALGRKRFGLVKYGMLLQPFNDRDPRKDRLAELMDALVYAEQELYEASVNHDSAGVSMASFDRNELFEACVRLLGRVDL